MTSTSAFLRPLVCFALLSFGLAFVPMSATTTAFSSTRLSEGMGNLEQLEFKIYPDGRVEETVRGVKGGNCQKITESINEMLGAVVASEPTEEMYEQEIVIDQTLTNTESVNANGNGSGDSWEGSSSW